MHVPPGPLFTEQSVERVITRTSNATQCERSVLSDAVCLFPPEISVMSGPPTHPKLIEADIPE